MRIEQDKKYFLWNYFVFDGWECVGCCLTLWGAKRAVRKYKVKQKIVWSDEK